MNKKQILILEVNNKNLDLLEEVFKGYEVFSVVSEEQLSNIAETLEEIDLVLVNSCVEYISPRRLNIFVNEGFDTKVPIVYLEASDEFDKGLFKECFEYGVSDFIKKPFESFEMLTRVEYHIEQMYHIREYRLRIEKLAGLATLDQLSKTSSRMHMQSVLKHYLDIYNKEKFDIGIVYLSLLNIEKVVSTFGFGRGEQILAAFSKELKKFLDEPAIISRWYGSEFMILLPKTPLEATKEIVKKLNSDLTKIEIYKDTKPLIAYGITEFIEEDSLEELAQRAKYALKEAKKQEYGRVYAC